ncbi:DarT ssDNA thymidine ADP-ribosyltransferase family protein [Atlantibacter hermannii]|uniref:DarT ssDNA thymidine ADP-ribosyltransferase family protein n=1 Tax=Atlantibacter hermannii TaxID=565 RepID=UPI0028AAC566|nr:DarT ssDNA thymidine ADP-ribosyltransferase family protein [Atlantibacter hermannii]
MTVQEVVQEREITRLFHFTHSDNLSSILENGLLSRSELDEEGNEYNYDFNDEDRFDGHRDAICLSISFPNAKMFWRYRNLKPGDWVILEINPYILWTKDCAFYPTNAASNNVRFKALDLMKGCEAFNALFFDEVFGIQREVNLPAKYTTDVQAEVLVFEKIDTEYIVNTFHPNRESAQHFKNLYPQTNQRYYANLNGPTLFSQRHYFLG